MVKSKKYNYIYKTTNTINGKIYIGVHSTNKLKDGYIGNGIRRQSDANREKDKKVFANAVYKYGYLNFKKEILYYFKTREEAEYYEKQIVNEKFVKKYSNYNIRLGGNSTPSIKGVKRSEKFKLERSRDILKNMDKLIELSSKEYVVVNIRDNKTYFIKNLAKFCREHNLSADGLNKIANKKVNLHKRTWWACKKEDWTGSPVLHKHKNLPIKGTLFNKNGDRVNFNSLAEASELTGGDRSSLSKLLRGKLKQVNGWYRKDPSNWNC